MLVLANVLNRQRRKSGGGGGGGGSQPPANLTPPTISRTGQVLTCDPGDWTGNPTLAYRWLRNGTAVAGATSASWSIPDALLGGLFTGEVVGTNAAGSGLPALAQAVYVGILDVLTAPVVVSSLQKLGSAHTSAVIIRNSSNNPATQDKEIGFTATGNLDTALLLSHVGSGSGSVSTWRHALGNTTFDGTQTVGSKQPRIASAGVVDVINGKPALKFSGAQCLDVLSFKPDRTAYPELTVSIVYQCDDLTPGKALWGADNGGFDRLQVFGWNVGFPNFGVSTGSGGVDQQAMNTTNAVVYTAVLRTGVTNGSYVAINNVPGTPFTEVVGTEHNYFTIGSINPAQGFMIGRISEILIYPRALSNAERSIMERNQGARYGITVA